MENEEARKEIARQIEEGYTSGRVDAINEDGKSVSIAWEIHIEAWTE